MQRTQQKAVFNSWLATYKGVFFKVVRAYAFRRQDQEDLFQEIAAQVWVSIPSFEGKAAPSTWIYRVALNTAISWSRKELRRRDDSQAAAGAAPALEPTTAPIDPRLDWLYEQIAQLDEIDRSLTLLLLDGFSYQEMADALGMSESNVGVRIHRIKAYLTRESAKRIPIMRFEELQAIWETQADKPIFSINEVGLALALYQQRQRGRRGLFWKVFFPSYITSTYMIGALTFICAAFYFKDTAERDFAMGLGDWLALLVAAGAFLVATGSMWRSRQQQEKSQNVVSPSLRQEIERGIAQIEFEVYAGTSAEAWRNSVLICIGAMLFAWEVGRLNGTVAPWGALLNVAAICCVGLLAGWIWARRWRADRSRRRQALEALLGKLDDTAR